MNPTSVKFPDSGLYLFLPSNSSKTFYPDNVISKYTTKLVQPLTLNPGSRYQIGLAELIIPSSALPSQIDSDLYCYSSICTQNYVGDSYGRLLRIIRLDNKRDNYEFCQIYFHDLESNFQIHHIEIFLADQKGKKFPFSPSSLPSIVVLCIKESSS